MKPDPNIGTEEEFEAFGPISPPSGETYWEYDEVKGLELERVWTVVDDGGETEDLYAVPGFHIVNTLGYMLTEHPWTDEGKSYYWYFDGRDRWCITLADGEEVTEFADSEQEALEAAEYLYDQKAVRAVLDA